MSKIRIIRIVCFSTILGLIGWGVIYYQLKNTQPTVVIAKQKSTGQAKLGGPFELRDQNGRLRNNNEFKGKYMLVYFGYSYCPDICPLGLQNMSDCLTKLKRDRAQVAPIFITVDPERDTPKQLNTYSGHFHPSFVMLSGGRQQIDKAIKNYKVYAAKVEDDSSTSYLVDHSTLIYLMDRQGNFLEAFPHTIDPALLAKAIESRLTDEMR